MLASPCNFPLKRDADGDGMAGGRSSDRLILKRERLSNMGKNIQSEEDEDLADCLIMLSKSADAIDADQTSVSRDIRLGAGTASRGQKFECKACKKVFGSHQALGGHRASHKKVKGCFRAKKATNQSDGEDEEESDHRPITSSEEKGHDHEGHQKRRLKGHECSICHRVFPSGQALGGHKRCHWLTTSSSAAAAEDLNTNPKPNASIGGSNQPCGLELDLNLAATEELDTDGPMKTEESCGKLADQVDENDDTSGCKVTLRKLSEVMDIHQLRLGSSSSWLRLSSGD